MRSVYFHHQVLNHGETATTLDSRPERPGGRVHTPGGFRPERALKVCSAQQPARAEFERAETLLASQAISQAEADTRRGALQTAEAAIAAANANVRARQLDLEFTRVTAPISGRVSDRRVDAGNLVGGGSSAADVLTTIVSTAPIHFVFDGSEAVLLKYQRQARRGAAPIQVRLQDESDYSRSGTLDFTDNAVDTASGVVRLRAVIANADGFLKPGMFGQARLAGAGSYQAMLVPDAAIATDQARRIVYVVANDGSVSPRAVQTGPLVDGLRVIRSGLRPDDRVIINGVQRIQQPGMKVQAQNGRIQPVASETQAPVTTPAPASTATFATSAG